MRRPTGRVRLWREGMLICQRDNLVVNAGLPAFARLSAGSTTGEYVSAVGFGSGNTAPTVNDTDLTGPQKYYNNVGTSIFPSPGTVTFNFALATADYAASGLTVQEIGLFANASPVAIPAVAGFSYARWVPGSVQPVGTVVQDATGRPFRSTTPPAWTSNTPVVAGQLITDANGNLQQSSTAGTTGSSIPIWSATIGNTTNDGSAIWTCIGLGGYAPTTGGSQPIWNATSIGDFTWDNTVAWQFLAALVGPQPMIAHAVVPAFAFSGAANYSGTWSLTF